MGAIFKIAKDMAGSTFGRDAIFSFCQAAHDLTKVAGKIEWETKFIKTMHTPVRPNSKTDKIFAISGIKIQVLLWF